MQAIKQWIICIMISSIIAAVVNIFTPDSSVQKTMKIVVASFLMCAFLSPFIDGRRIDFSEDFPGFSIYYSSLSEEISLSVTDETEKAVKNKVESLLKERGIEYDDIEVSLERNEENQLYIDKIIITADEEYSEHENEIKEEIKNVFSAEIDCKWVKK